MKPPKAAALPLIALAALSRLLPHPPNFSPVEAIALFGGAYFGRKSLALVVPLLAMLLSDFALGLLKGGLYAEYFLSAGFLTVYAAIVLSTVLGFALRGRVSVWRFYAPVPAALTAGSSPAR